MDKIDSYRQFKDICTSLSLEPSALPFMATPSDDSKMTLSSAIPTGPWTFYFHSSEETKWTLNTFINLGSMKTWQQFWSIIELLKTESFSDGMFFLMRDPSPPLWESHHHIRGGCYSIRSSRKDATDVYLTYSIAAMLNVASSPDNRINGISISPKRGHNIIKVWNTDSQNFNRASSLQALGSIREADIIYTPFVQKKM
jgi:hypothetical protein